MCTTYTQSSRRWRGLGPGAYRLTWRVVSADGHPVGGSFAFWIGASQTEAAPDSAAATTESTTWGPTFKGAPLVPATLRGLGLGSLMALGGLLLFIVLPHASSAAVTRDATRLANWLALAAALLLALHLGAWILNVTPDHQLAGDSATAVLRSTRGQGRALAHRARVPCALGGVACATSVDLRWWWPPPRYW